MPRKKSEIKEKIAESKAQKYIIRSLNAGVFFAEIKKRQGTEAVLINARKIWSWEGACGVEELAVNGSTKPKECLLTVVVPEMTVLGVCEVLPCSEKAAKCWENVDVWSSAK